MTELLLLLLIAALIFLLIGRTTIRSLKSELASLQNEIRALKSEKDSAHQEISRQARRNAILSDSLVKTKQELEFYKNIQEESGKLNEPNEPVHSGNAQLDAEQAAICAEIEDSNASFFITGKAGTGKSFLLEAFKRSTKKANIVLAPTGRAALNVGGVTLHSVFGYYNLVNLDINDISPETIHLKSEKILVLKHASTIIIDEISMVRADTFDKIDRILKVINRNNYPFGGKQLLLFGDLFQLPPIANKAEYEYLYDRYGGVHFFCSDAFRQSDFQCRELTINHRQNEDAEFFELLNRVRDGTFTPKDITTLNRRVARDLSIYDRFITLLPTKAEAERINRDRIRQLDSTEYTYKAEIIKDKPGNQNHSIDSIFPIVETLRLKKGVLVMMVANDLNHKWVNGTLGIISELSDNSISVAINKTVYNIEPVQFSEQEAIYANGKLMYEEVFTVEQYPVVPAYAITIHKSQGQTYQNIICDINRCFADGQAYVALSRCSSLDGLHLTQEINRTSIRIDKAVLDFYYGRFPKPQVQQNQNSK